MGSSLSVVVPDELPDVSLADLGAIVGTGPGSGVQILVETLLADHMVALEEVVHVLLITDLALKLPLELCYLNLGEGQVVCKWV